MTPSGSSKPSALPSAPGALRGNVVSKTALGGMGKPNSRDPLLPPADRLTISANTPRSTPQKMPIGQETRRAPPATPLRAGVRGSFERIWRRNSQNLSPPTIQGPNENGDVSESDVAEMSQDMEMVQDTFDRDLEAAKGVDEGDRNHYAPEDALDLEDAAIDDIGDGALGGGVVMEMGRVSGDVRSLASNHRNSERGHGSTPRVEIEDEDELFPPTPILPSQSRASGSIDDRRLSSPGPRDYNDARLASKEHRLSPLQGTAQSRHARFAPSPPKSPRTIASSDGTSPSTSALPVRKSSHSIFSWRRHRAAMPDPPYMVPVMSPKTGKPMRNYKFHPSSNGFFLRGHVVTGGDAAWPFLGALALVLGTAGTWFATTCVFWWRKGSGGQAVAVIGGYLCLLTLASMFMTVRGSRTPISLSTSDLTA